jgi:4-amino-4-deoxy-L-arabinose transferase-like glycosyltransferase
MLYFGVYLIITLSMVFKQPFGNPPDEYNRYLIPQYICSHGTLPNGFDEEIRIPGYGFSYAFQPILPYMLQGYTMRLVSMFTGSESVLLYTARLVNLLLGLIMSYVVLLLGRKWFADRRLSWLFSFIVTFLPQSIFVHTYVNTDSCCMLSIALILYAMTLCLENDFSLSSSLLLSLGIILCALSYYNAYAYILSAILIFIAYFIKKKSTFYIFIKKGLIIAVPVLAGIGWWFIRSAVLYDGDFLGLKTRNYCGSLYAISEYKPENMNTYLNQGYSIIYMLFNSDFVRLSILSFIGIFGPMTIVSTIWLYRFYKLLFFVGLAAELVHIPFAGRFRGKKPYRKTCAQFSRLSIFLHMNMIFCIIMPVLLSIWYSYASDYQPQGRYILPALIPICYYCVSGFEKIFWLIEAKLTAKLTAKPAAKIPASEAAEDNAPKLQTTGKKMTAIIYWFIMLCIILLLFITVYIYAFPCYV